MYLIIQCLTVVLLAISQIQSESDWKQHGQLPKNLETCLGEKKVRRLIFTTSDEDYDRLNYQWNSRLGDIQPLAIATPTSVRDVQIVIKCAKDSGKRVVARSGGHWYAKTSYATDLNLLSDDALYYKRDRLKVDVPIPDYDTIVIDLAGLDEISVDQNAGTAHVGSGVLLGPLYWNIWNNGGFCFPAGTNPALGAGQTLGGGFGVLSKRFGMSLDNVLEMELVDADGDVRTASAAQNSDLFWALRGAGAGNFGIVTKFKYQLHDVSDQLFVKVKYTFRPQDVAQVVRVWNTLLEQSRNDLNAYAVLQYESEDLSLTLIDLSWPDDQVALIERHLSPESVKVEYQNFIELMTHISDEVPLGQPSDLANVTTQDVTPEVFLAKSYYSNKILTALELRLLTSVLVRIPKHILVTFNVYGGAVNSKASHATSFVHRTSLQEISVRVLEESPGEEDWISEFNKVGLAILDNGESYQNLVDGRLEDSLVRFYGKNLEKLVQVKKLVDPDNFFNFPQSIPIALNQLSQFRTHSQI